MDLRRATRYRVHAPVIFQWIDEEGVQRQAGGFTRDISTGGIFVLSAMSPPIGTGISLEVILPSLAAASRGCQLKADGRVVRVESEGFGGTADFGQQAKMADLGL